MNATPFQAFLEDVGVPLITMLIRAHQQGSGTSNLPTDAQIIALLGTDTQFYENLGNTFLQSKGAIPTPPAA